ncbi:ABC transporter permease [Microvirga sp. W0021]|uniref:ABC transporter permease n=1 Tax=Hohaiivirga grylli TaxID=3133970 RepID=A0ABV0BI37_9HYPH
MNRLTSNPSFKAMLRQYGGLILALVALCLFFSYQHGAFFSVSNFVNIMIQVTVVAIAAFGMTYVILLGDIDLSVGSMIAVAGMVAAQCFISGFGFMSTLAITLFAGLVMGAINGMLVAKLSLPAFIVTLATMGIYRGAVSLPTQGKPARIDDEMWYIIGNEGISLQPIGIDFEIPYMVVILAVVFILNALLLSKTVFGRRTYLMGGNREAAVYSGIKVDRIRIIIFMLCGLMAAISGVILSARLGSAQVNAGQGYELDAIAAAVLGGTSLAGGAGTMVGTLLGAILIGVINNGMSLMNVEYFYQLIAKGIVIILAVYLDVRSKKART